MSIFEQVLIEKPIILTEGSMFDRLKREAGQYFDEALDHLGLVFHSKGQEVLARVYSEYIQVGLDSELPIIVFTPTWRANSERISRSNLSSEDVNSAGATFLTDLRDQLSSNTGDVLVGGLLGCKNDCYSPAEALNAEEAAEFHAPQIAALADTQVDFLFGSTLPAVSEAAGMAEVMSEAGLPYMLSFVIRGNGEVLDGTPLFEVVDRLDNQLNNPPARYMVNCVYPTVFAEAMRKELSTQPDLGKRLVGLQANTSRRSVEELDELQELETEDAAIFGQAVSALHEEFHTQILGGCCGTSTEHIESIARCVKEAASTAV